tara:strand:- start:225 stop:2180 length:1956 start_codon:yes stop_codon:yes gene_type:complete
MSVPLIASSLTTIAAFIPLVSIAGPMGGMIEVIPIVMVCVITASLVEVFIILPAHLNKAKVPAQKDKKTKAWVAKAESMFASTAVVALRHKYLVIISSLLFVVGVAAIPAMGLINFTFSPETQTNYSVLSVEFKPEASRQQQRDFLSYVESEYLALNKDYPDKPIQITTYEGKGNAIGSFDVDQIDRSMSRLTVFYQPQEIIDANMTDIEWIEEFISSLEIPAYVSTFKNAYADSKSQNYDLTIALQAEDPEALALSSVEFKARIMGLDGVASVNRLNTKEVSVYDISLKDEARNKGITESEVKGALQLVLQSSKITEINEGSFSHEVLVSVGKKETYRKLSPQDVPILLNGRVLRLGDVADVNVVSRDSSVMRINGVRTAEFGIMLEKETEVGPYELYDTIEEEVISSMQSQYPIMFGLSGQSQQESKTLDDMISQSVIAIVLIYIILSLAFSSYAKPLLIMSIIPFSVMGAVLGHFIMGYDFSALSVLSVFGLSGIVVNNTIAIMHEYDHKMKCVDDKAVAMILALKSRFRAIFVTTITTISGLIPLLVTQEIAADYLKPMAISIVFGLLFTMFLVCYTFPAVMMIGKNTKSIKGNFNEYNEFVNKKRAVLKRIQSQKTISAEKIARVRQMPFSKREAIFSLHDKFKLA